MARGVFCARMDRIFVQPCSDGLVQVSPAYASHESNDSNMEEGPEAVANVWPRD